MDDVEFIKAKRRLCTSTDCLRCPFKINSNKSCAALEGDNPEEYVRILEKWSKENPAETNRNRFEEVFGFDLADHFMLSTDIFSWLQKEYKDLKE